MPKIDIPIKRMIQRRSQDWIRFLLPNCRAEWVRPLPTERTPKVQSRMDEVFSIDDPENPCIVHLEPQAYNDPAFPARMLRYRADIWEATLSEGKGTPRIYQAAIFFFPQHENAVSRLEDDGLQYSYHIIRLWQTDKAKVLNDGLAGLYPLLPLMKTEAGETPTIVLQQAIGHINSISDEALRCDLLAALGIIGGEKYSAGFVKDFIRSIPVISKNGL